MLNRYDPNIKWNGFQSIVLESKNNVTYPKELFYDLSSRVSPVVHLDGIKYTGPFNELVYYLIHFGGGYLSGERLGTNIVLNEKARAIITTTSPAAIYKCKGEDVTSTDEYIEVRKDAYLTYICDDIIAYEFSRYKQTNKFMLYSGCHLIFSDIIGPGWSSKDKNYTFDWIKLRSDFYLDDELYEIDNLRVVPSELDLSSIGNLSDFLYYGTIFVYDDLVDEKLVLVLRAHLKEVLDASHIEFGITKLDGHGLIVRLLSKREEQANKAIIYIANWVRTNLWKFSPINLKKF